MSAFLPRLTALIEKTFPVGSTGLIECQITGDINEVIVEGSVEWFDGEPFVTAAYTGFRKVDGALEAIPGFSGSPTPFACPADSILA